jgi:hypothetical protein
MTPDEFTDEELFQQSQKQVMIVHPNRDRHLQIPKSLTLRRMPVDFKDSYAASLTIHNIYNPSESINLVVVRTFFTPVQGIQPINMKILLGASGGVELESWENTVFLKPGEKDTYKIRLTIAGDNLQDSRIDIAAVVNSPEEVQRSYVIQEN